MERKVIATPVSYRDVADKMSPPTFYKLHRRTVGNVYLHKDIAENPQRVTEALLRRCPHGVLRGFAALRHMGFTLNLDDWTPMISIPRTSPPVRARKGRILRLVENDVISINGQRSVAATQAVVDVFTRPDSWGRWRDGGKMEEQVALLDHLLRQDLNLLRGLQNDVRTQAAAALANPLAESRPESIVRARLHLAGFKEWKPQIRVRGRDGYYFIDLGDPILRVGIEYQGAHHFGREERAKDARRANDLKWAGWATLEVTSVILDSDAQWQSFLRRLKEELAAAQQQRNSRLSRGSGGLSA